MIISRKGLFNHCFALIDSIACLLTSYYYSWKSCFGVNDDDNLRLHSIIIESCFLIAMIIKFLTDYTEEG